jgi:Lon protease-like protein
LADRIPILTLGNILLPNTDLGVHVYEDPYRALVSHSLSNGHTFGVVLSGREVGTLARIGGYARLPDGRYLLEVEGTKRFRVVDMHANGSYPKARVHWLHEHIGNFGDARRDGDEVARLFHVYRSSAGDGDLPVHLPVDPVARSFAVASQLRVGPEEKQELLECPAADRRLAAELAILTREIATLEELRSTRA